MFCLPLFVDGDNPLLLPTIGISLKTEGVQSIWAVPLFFVFRGGKQLRLIKELKSYERNQNEPLLWIGSNL